MEQLLKLIPLLNKVQSTKFVLSVITVVLFFLSKTSPWPAVAVVVGYFVCDTIKCAFTKDKPATNGNEANGTENGV